jgi:hypothetical protein
VYRARRVDVSKSAVPIIPEMFFKYFLPNKPNNKNPASGNKGISAIIVALGILV